MPRYYFHFEDGHTSLDHDGVELPDLAALRNEALRASGEALRDGASPEFWGGTSWRMWVTDAPGGSGNTLLTLRFSGVDGS